MYTIQTERQREGLLLQKTSLTTLSHNNNLNAMKAASSLVAIKSTKEGTRRLICKSNINKTVQVQSWKHQSMTKSSVRDLLSEYVNPTEEGHMNLPSSKKRCSDRAKMLMYLPFAATLGLSTITTTTTTSSYEDKHDALCNGERRHSRVSDDDAAPAPQKPIRRVTSRHLLGHNSIFFNNNNNREEKEPSSLLLKGECYPRFRLDRILGKDDVALALYSFQARLDDRLMSPASFVEDNPDDGMLRSGVEEEEEEDDSLLKRSESFIKEQEAIWLQVTTEQQQKTTTKRPPRPKNSHNIKNNDHDPLLFRQERTSFHDTHSHQQHHQRPQRQDEGTRIRVFDQERVYTALNEGSATVLKCLGCSKHMLATSDIKLIFCPACGTLTPLDMGQASESSEYAKLDN